MEYHARLARLHNKNLRFPRLLSKCSNYFAVRDLEHPISIGVSVPGLCSVGYNEIQ